jgi:hypothetical protein
VLKIGKASQSVSFRESSGKAPSAKLLGTYGAVSLDPMRQPCRMKRRQAMKLKQPGAYGAPLHSGADGALLNKVPKVTAYFWIIKVMATTVGETAADLLSVRLNFGLTITSYVMSAFFLITLLIQLRAKRYRPPLYWVTVVAISIVGTLISDNLVDGMGISLVTTSIVFAVILAVVFAAWYACERTLSIHTIVTRRRELFYWQQSCSPSPWVPRSAI